MKEEEREQSHSTRPNFGCTSSLKSEDSTFLEKLNSLEYRGLQELFVSTLLGGARFSGALEKEASKSEEAAKNAVVHLGEKLAEHKRLSVASNARESVLQKQTVGLSGEVPNLKEASEVAESRCESRLRSLGEELEASRGTAGDGEECLGRYGEAARTRGKGRWKCATNGHTPCSEA